MKSRVLIVVLIISIISTIFAGCENKINDELVSNLNNDFVSKIDIHPEPLDYMRGKVTDINEIYNSDRDRYELRGYDASELDFTNIKLNNFIFDSQTIWTDKLPNGFDIETIIEYGKKPGLGVDELHKQNITGKGVSVGVIDGRLLVDHEEFSSNIRLYEEIFEMEGPAHYHGTPITSILGGKNVGVAPNVNIFYIAYLDENTETEDGYIYLAKAIERMVEINSELPEDGKIKVVSISSGWNPESENAQAIYNAIDKAKDEDMFVITARLFDTHNFDYDGLDRDPMNNPKDKESYYSATHFGIDEPVRWLASPTGIDEYVMYSKGAWSMVIPYISGLYALACEVDPNITPEIFWEIALSSADNLILNGEYPRNTEENKRLVKPIELISIITEKKR